MKWKMAVFFGAHLGAMGLIFLGAKYQNWPMLILALIIFVSPVEAWADWTHK